MVQWSHEFISPTGRTRLSDTAHTTEAKSKTREKTEMETREFVMRLAFFVCMCVSVGLNGIASLARTIITSFSFFSVRIEIVDKFNCRKWNKVRAATNVGADIVHLQSNWSDTHTYTFNGFTEQELLCWTQTVNDLCEWTFGLVRVSQLCI